jgi:Fic family protein
MNLREVERVIAGEEVKVPPKDFWEVENYIRAMRMIEDAASKRARITERLILKIHRLMMDRVLPKEECGAWRKRIVYVVRKEGGKKDEIVYTGPPPVMVKDLMKNFTEWLERSAHEGIHPIVAAGIAHAELAAIHPFSDGNGRVARALATLILYGQGYDFRRLFALEDYYNKDRDRYYEAIHLGVTYKDRHRDFTPWLEYFVEGFKEEIENVRRRVTAAALQKISKHVEKQLYLTARQTKIVDMLMRQGRATIHDVLQLLECPKRTAQFELQKLKKMRIVKQMEKGPAAFYILNE